MQINNKTELESLIRFAEINGMMNWSFEAVLNEYETTKMHHDEIDNKMIKTIKGGEERIKVTSLCNTVRGCKR